MESEAVMRLLAQRLAPAESPARVVALRRRLLGLSLLASFDHVWSQQATSTSIGREVDRGEIENSLALQRQSVCSARNKAGSGLQGQYFSNPRCAGQPLLTRMDGPVDFLNTPDWPDKKFKSVRWQGWVRPPLPGRYLFHLDGQASEIFIGRQLVSAEQTSQAVPIEFAAGRYYPLEVRVEVRDAQSLRAQLKWTAPHGIKFLIPRASLYPPTA